MAGLLDIFGTSGADTMGLLGMSPEDIGRSRDEAQAQALYALAGRLFKGGSGASSVLEGLQQGQQAYKQAMQGGLQEQLQKAQLQEMLKKKQQEEQQKKQELMARQLLLRGYQPAVAGQASMPVEEDGRFIGDSQAIAAQPARFDLSSVAPELMALGPAGQAQLKTALDLQKSMAGETFKLGEGEKQYQRDPLTGVVKEVATGAPKVKEPQSDIQKYEYAKKNDGYKGSFTQFLLDERRAGAANQTVNMGQKGLDNTLKIRGEFKSEPIYKAHQEIQSAYGQIGASLNSGTPVGDLAAATKIMKLLDPGSVVRESELALAMAASGALDRLTSYGENIINGTKLTAQQRKDFQALANRLFDESSRLYNAKRSEYAGIAKRNDLNVEDIVGTESLMKSKVKPTVSGWSNG